jgi:hypothetical protein
MHLLGQGHHQLDSPFDSGSFSSAPVDFGDQVLEQACVEEQPISQPQLISAHGQKVAAPPVVQPLQQVAAPGVYLAEGQLRDQLEELDHSSVSSSLLTQSIQIATLIVRCHGK